MNYLPPRALENHRVNVILRVRPMFIKEVEQNLTPSWTVTENRVHTTNNLNEFSYDYAFGKSSDNREIFQVIKPIIDNVLCGFNATVLAFGQTTSGKTHTMFGNDRDQGVIVQGVYEMFNLIEKRKERQFDIKANYIEIYNEEINDLLDKNCKNIDISVKKDESISLNCSEVKVSTRQELMNVIIRGNKWRQVAETHLNKASSRGHAILIISIRSKMISEENNKEAHATQPILTSQMFFVDLAGAEFVSHVKSKTQLIEGHYINISLSVLTKVIMELSENCQNVSYTDSKLTQVLSKSLGRNSKTVIIGTISPIANEETISTLQFSRCAMNIKCDPRVNEIIPGVGLINKSLKKDSAEDSEDELIHIESDAMLILNEKYRKKKEDIKLKNNLIVDLTKQVYDLDIKLKEVTLGFSQSQIEQALCSERYKERETELLNRIREQEVKPQNYTENEHLKNKIYRLEADLSKERQKYQKEFDNINQLNKTIKELNEIIRQKDRHEKSIEQQRGNAEVTYIKEPPTALQSKKLEQDSQSSLYPEYSDGDCSNNEHYIESVVQYKKTLKCLGEKISQKNDDLNNLNEMYASTVENLVNLLEDRLICKNRALQTHHYCSNNAAHNGIGDIDELQKVMYLFESAVQKYGTNFMENEHSKSTEINELTKSNIMLTKTVESLENTLSIREEELGELHDMIQNLVTKYQ